MDRLTLKPLAKRHPDIETAVQAAVGSEFVTVPAPPRPCVIGLWTDPQDEHYRELAAAAELEHLAQYNGGKAP